MSLNELVFDTWTTLTFKQQFGPRRVPGPQTWTAPSWVGEEHRRRSWPTWSSRRTSTTLPGVPPQQERPGEGGAPGVRRPRPVPQRSLCRRFWGRAGHHGRRSCRRPRGRGADAEQIQLARRQQAWLEQWADAERFPEKMQECESNAVGLGDGVYTLGWSSEQAAAPAARVRPRLLLPGAGRRERGRLPRARAYRLGASFGLTGKVKVRRLTWELEDLEEPRPVPYQDEPVTKTCLLHGRNLDPGRRGRVGGRPDPQHGGVPAERGRRRRRRPGPRHRLHPGRPHHEHGGRRAALRAHPGLHRPAVRRHLGRRHGPGGGRSDDRHPADRPCPA
jgi:hypothetical protein